MSKTNEATDTDLKVIERLQQIGWKQKMLYISNNINFGE